MSDLKCAQMLFDAAERDLLTLQGMTAGVPEESFGFHVQQAAEKALKPGWPCWVRPTRSPTTLRRYWISSPTEVL